MFPSVSVLGGFQFEQGASRLRSRSSELVLGILICLGGSEVSKWELADYVWPNSDGDRQDQNLRKSISDIRSALGREASQGLLVHNGRLSLRSDALKLDVTEFRITADKGLSTECPETLEAAVQLYGGPLLPNCEFPKVSVLRAELEQKYAHVAQTLMTHYSRWGQLAAAIETGLSALQAAPLREDLHVAVIQAYSSAGQSTEALRRFEALEQLLDDQWGEVPSARAMQALDVQEIPQHAVTEVRPRDVYIRRSADDVFDRAVRDSSPTILIHGPRQVGKTTLLARTLRESRALGVRVALTDFQALNASQLADVNSFYRALAAGFMLQLGVKLDIGAAWSDWLGPNANFESVVEAILGETDCTVTWAMDEADRLFGQEFSDDFFGLLRSWHNRRQFQIEGPWARLQIIISYATEANLFIKNIHQSPFNVGTKVLLQDFSRTEFDELVALRQPGFATGFADAIWDLVQGHPYLSRVALDNADRQESGWSKAIEQALTPDGLFYDHLERLMIVIQKDEEVAAAVSRFLESGELSNPKIKARLVSGGLLRTTNSGPVFRIPLYEQFLRLRAAELV